MPKSLSLNGRRWPSRPVRLRSIRIVFVRLSHQATREFHRARHDSGGDRAALPPRYLFATEIQGHSAIIHRLERKRNILNAQRGSRNSPSPQITSQIDQIDNVLESLAVRSESIYDLQMTVGLRLPQELASFQRKALASIAGPWPA